MRREIARERFRDARVLLGLRLVRDLEPAILRDVAEHERDAAGPRAVERCERDLDDEPSIVAAQRFDLGAQLHGAAREEHLEQFGEIGDDSGDRIDGAADDVARTDAERLFGGAIEGRDLELR